MSPQAALELHQGTIECAGAVTGTVRWWDNRRGHQVGVVLRFRTEGRGDRDTALAGQYVLGTQEAGHTSFRLDVPATGPVTYHGQLIRVLWEVAVVIPVNRSPARPGTGVSVAPLTVLPWGWSRLPPGALDAR